MKISAVILTKNSSETIRKCLKSVSFCDEIVVIDDYSSDDTLKIVKKFTSKIYKRHLNNDFSGQRNFSISKTKNEWVLFIDSDEVISPKLRTEILNLKFEIFNSIDGFYTKRRDIIWGRKLRYGESGDIKLLRLARKSKGRWRRSVHESWHIKGKVGILKNEIEHYPHENLKEFVKKVNFYSKIHAKELNKENKKSSILLILLKPLGKFINNYFILQGFRDGVPGLLVAIVMSFHSFLALSKLWTSKKN